MNIREALSISVRTNMARQKLKLKNINLGVGFQALSNQLNGKTSWDVERIIEFAEALGMTGSELLRQAEDIQDGGIERGLSNE